MYGNDLTYVHHSYRGDHLKGAIINCPRKFLDKSLLDHHSIVHSSNDHFKSPYNEYMQGRSQTLPDGRAHKFFITQGS